MSVSQTEPLSSAHNYVSYLYVIHNLPRPNSSSPQSSHGVLHCAVTLQTSVASKIASFTAIDSVTDFNGVPVK